MLGIGIGFATVPHGFWDATRRDVVPAGRAREPVVVHTAPPWPSGRLCTVRRPSRVGALPGLVLLAAFALHGCSGGNEDEAQGGNNLPEVPITPKGWELAWSDEFDGDALDEGNWNIQLGDGTAEGIPGWGNNELQTYQRANATVDGGMLTITARAEAVEGRAYTSARINTAGNFDFQYGRVEARIAVPGGQGLWSAFWMLPTDAAYGTWAASGEIDIMEVYSRDPRPFTLGVAHYGMAWPLNVFTGTRYEGIDPADGFHTYALEWDAEELRWFVDGVHFNTVTRATYWTYYVDEETNAHQAGSDSAPFDKPFHLLLNVAVGGNLPGDPDPAALPAEMQVDYVRVYRCNIDTDDGLGCDGFEDLVDPAVAPPPPDDVFQASYDLYVDALAPLAFSGTELTVPLEFGVWDNGGALVLSEVDGGEDRGMVIDVNTTGGGNISVFPADLSRQNLFGMGSASAPGNYGGELQFDLYVFGAETDSASALQVKLDSGFPDLGFVELAVADLPQDEWTTVTVQISDIAHNPGSFGGGPVDLGSVLSLFVLEPTGAAHLRVDNLKLVCGHPDDRGCGIVPPETPRDTTEPFDVYVDAVDPTWDVGINGADSGTGWANYADGTNPDNKIQWREIDADDPSPGRILEVTFTDSTASGVWFIQSTRGVDLTSYSAGYVSFDIKVDDYGANADGMTMKIDCIFPCTSGDQPIGKVGDGAWETVRIPVSQLLSGGLNLASVNTGLVIFPTDQSVALTFQLDNIQWLPGAPVKGTPQEVYTDSLASGWSLWDCCGGATLTEVADDAEHGTVVEMSFGATPTVAGFLRDEGVDVSALSDGTLEFDLKEVSPPPDGSQWHLKLESSNAATAVDILLADTDNPAPGSEWQHYRFTLQGDLAGLDLSDVNLVMVFPDWGVADGAVVRIDNVVFKPAAHIELFADAVNPDWFLWDCCGGASFGEVVDDDAAHGNVIELTFHGGGTVTGFQAVSSIDASAFADGALEFDFREVSPPPEGSQWNVKLESVDAATAAELRLTDAGNPQPGNDWQTYSFGLGTDLAGLDLSALKLVMVFPDWGNSEGAVARLDNVRLVPAR